MVLLCRQTKRRPAGRGFAAEFRTTSVSCKPQYSASPPLCRLPPSSLKADLQIIRREDIIQKRVPKRSHLLNAETSQTAIESRAVATITDLDRLFAEIKREKGKLDIVFANAGVAKYAPF